MGAIVDRKMERTAKSRRCICSREDMVGLNLCHSPEFDIRPCCMTTCMTTCHNLSCSGKRYLGNYMGETFFLFLRKMPPTSWTNRTISLFHVWETTAAGTFAIANLSIKPGLHWTLSGPDKPGMHLCFIRLGGRVRGQDINSFI